MYHFQASAYIHSFTGPENNKLRYDLLKAVSALQGLVNRDRCRLYMTFMDETDEYWLKHYRSADGFLSEEDWHELKDWDELLNAFKPWLTGVVLWDEEVPATSNVAATICGVEGLLPVRYDPSPGSFYSQFIAGDRRLPVKRSLIGLFSGTGTIPGSGSPSTGSAKCDAYLWAKENYLDAELCDPTLLAYYLDGHRWIPDGEWYPDLNNTMLSNHDYYIARKAFFFDLSPWDDETPGDDPDQPPGADLRTMKDILLSQYRNSGSKQIFTIGGFTPWYVKYTDASLWPGKHGAIETEWRHAEILSCYNAIMDADAYGLSGMANASIHRHYSLRERYEQSRSALAARKPERGKVYVMFYMGDYDSAAWLNAHVGVLWDDPRRGELPLAWGFNPNLSERVPQVFDYVYRTKSDRDVFVSGDSGAGYINPTHLLEPRIHSGLPSGMDAWIAHNRRYYERFDLTITGFLLNGYDSINTEVQRGYAEFSPDGVVTQEYQGPGEMDGTPFQQLFHNIGPYGTIREAVDVVYGSLAATEEPQFIVYRTVLVSPSFLVELLETIAAERPEISLEPLDPYTFFGMKKQYQSEEQR
ncbi:GxGYxYP domain-containing protein [Paenibacillus agaridevorans]|uniref:GxGYxYP domain-containing protein n=1 Tax=Paenibacillus agaridevorans TaxID=171404 RepID=UPI001BE4B4A4|nr:GxGYxYP domain-containing protein [Paenibacillus agaridevorans]